MSHSESDRQFEIAGLPAGSDQPENGGVGFVAYCLGGEARARHRRKAIQRGLKLHRASLKSGDYHGTLILVQRLSLAYADLGRILYGLQSVPDVNAIHRVSTATFKDMKWSLDRVQADADYARRVLRLPESITTEDSDVQAALIEASDTMIKDWLPRIKQVDDSWDELGKLAKILRHGGPIPTREMITETPGAGVLGKRVPDLSNRWVLEIDTSTDKSAKNMTTTYWPRDLQDKVVRNHIQVALDAVSLTRDLSGAVVNRLELQAKWIVPARVVRKLSSNSRRVLELNRV